MEAGPTRFALVAHRLTSTNRALLRAAASLELRPVLVTPDEALASARAGDVALGRLDVRGDLDGIEDGLWQLRRGRGGRGAGGKPASGEAAPHDQQAAATPPLASART